MKTLLTPVELGPVRLRNRVVSTSHQTSLVHDHLPTDDLVAYQEARARGGVGAIFLEATAVHPTGLLTAHTLGGFLPGHRAGLPRASAAALHEHGTRLFVQLFHGGREQISAAPRAPAVAPSAVPSPRFKVEPRALTRGRAARRSLRGYARSARLCREGGVDGIEVSMSHGYLVAQFFSPAHQPARRRTTPAPLRFAREVLAAVRDAAGPGARRRRAALGRRARPRRPRRRACAEIAARAAPRRPGRLRSLRARPLGLRAGSTWIVPPPPRRPTRWSAPLARMRAALDVPLIGTTRRLRARGRRAPRGRRRRRRRRHDPRADRRSGARGQGRAGPRADDRAASAATRPASATTTPGVPIACIVNPRTGRERTLPRARGRRAGLRVAVVGAGPAGVAAALEAARPRRRGDAVRARRGRSAGSCGSPAARRRTPRLWRRWHAGAAAPARRRAGRPAPGARGTAARAGRRRPRRGRHRRAAVPAGAGRRPAMRRRLGGDRRAGGRRRARARRGLGRRVGRARRGRGAGRAAGSRSRSPAPPRAPARRSTSTSATSTSPAATSAGSASATTPSWSPGAALRHVFSGRVEPLPDVATLVFAQGREPEDALWEALEGRAGRVRAGRRARPALGRGGDARGRARAAGGARGGELTQTTASSPSRCATPAASVRERTSSLARMRETCTLAVFSAM